MEHGEPGHVVDRLYELISGPADHERDWQAVRDLFLPDARLRSELVIEGAIQSGEWTVEQFVEEAAEDYRQNGFWERSLAARMERYGNIAHVWTTYDSRVGSADTQPVVRGINSIQLLRRDGRWRIASIVFQIERGVETIPDRYL